jgi:hypothetical protein
MYRAIDSLACWQRRSEGAAIDRIWTAGLAPKPTRIAARASNDRIRQSGASPIAVRFAMHIFSRENAIRFVRIVHDRVISARTTSSGGRKPTLFGTRVSTELGTPRHSAIAGEAHVQLSPIGVTGESG